MEKEIQTGKGLYKYKEQHFQNGMKKINRDIAKQNLLDFKKILDENNILFGLIYGTLLGAIRENNFIEHDEDTDVFILEEDREKFLELLFLLKDEGFIVGRYSKSLLSLIRDGEYIDIYFFHKKNKNYRECEGYIIKSDFLENLENYHFLGESFKIPAHSEKLLVVLYGKDWKIPKENTPASNYGLYLKIRFFIKNNFSLLFKMISQVKKRIMNV